MISYIRREIFSWPCDYVCCEKRSVLLDGDSQACRRHLCKTHNDRPFHGCKDLNVSVSDLPESKSLAQIMHQEDDLHDAKIAMIYEAVRLPPFRLSHG